MAASWQARGGATPNKGQRYPAEVLTAEEVTALLRQCSHRAPAGIRNRALLMLLYRSGLRVSEVLALRPADVNLTAHTVRVLHGGPLHPQYVRNLLHRLAARAGISKRVHPHGLRHTFAWELENAGTPVTVISALLGHSSVAVTARYLAHLTNHQAVTALAAAALPEMAL